MNNFTNVSHIVGWTFAAQTLFIMLLFWFCPYWCRKVLSRVIALGFAIEGFWDSFWNHYDRIMYPEDKKEVVKTYAMQRTNVVPMDQIQSSNAMGPIDEEVVKALIGQGASKSNAMKAVLSFKDRGGKTFEQLFRMALGTIATAQPKTKVN